MHYHTWLASHLDSASNARVGCNSSDSVQHPRNVMAAASDWPTGTDECVLAAVLLGHLEFEGRCWQEKTHKRSVQIETCTSAAATPPLALSHLFLACISFLLTHTPTPRRPTAFCAATLQWQASLARPATTRQHSALAP